MKFVNLTPHAIVLQTLTGERITAPPSGAVARVASKPGVVGPRDGFPVPVAAPTTYGEVEGIPAPAEGMVYLVSALVLGRCSRPDVFAPGTGPADGAIRYPAGHAQAGQIEAVTRLIAAI